MDRVGAVGSCDREDRPMKARSSPDTAVFGNFLSRLPIALAVALATWLVLRPALDTIQCGLAEMIIRGYEQPRVTRLVPEDHRAQIRRSDLHAQSAVPTVSLTETHFNTIVLLALFLAMPRPWSRPQAERLVMGWCVLLGLQTLNLVFHVKFIYATALGDWSLQHYSAVSRNIYGFLQYFTDLPGRFASPFLIWIGFNWDQVMGMISADVGKRG